MARTGTLQLTNATLETPAFMPVGTQGSVKAMSQTELYDEIGYRLILGNTYHLYLRPGLDVIEAAGGLRRFINWDGAMLTDSGGFQVFSLSDLSKITDDGVTFKSHIDGSLHHFSPEHSIKVQHVLDSDIIMAFDQCPPYPASRDDVGLAVRRTHEWLVRCRDYHEESGRADRQSLFGIVQGGVYEDMRIESSQFVSDMNLPGVAIGGVSVGEPTEWVSTVLEWCVPHLPVDKPRYLMGVGSPLDLIECVARGIDLFDCVLPTRLGRNGTLYTSVGKVNIKGARYARDMGPVDPSCQCAVCKRYSAAYLRHLYKSREILGCRLATYHNLSFIADLMRRIRLSIAEGTYSALRQKIHAAYESRSSW